ncbi:DUF6460 domain-containing protein [Amphiplicatus metriothermophilus]|uniref:DUF6460 domain-containing protein n=1 Tax=Amphiplicatus metriothermophilus TaxID=1519374 RepID=A0A239PV21_9PROT|nr:DUF6460 domain-containing protein [Amphiplicatus metriothermophilus]MBB5519585.1 ABC-type multidrug transport system permease subunit [Amphiplicatus metriothermophilus]SNT74149.1 hypothetical protein SAMN06297382_2057 [Amphiplicatus metriothermophilus]
MAENDLKTRLVGRSAGKTIIQLVVASILVGALLSVIGLGPREFWGGIFHLARDLVSALGDSIGEIAGRLATWLVIGAAVVAPVWIVLRLLGGGRRPAPRE